MTDYAIVYPDHRMSVVQAVLSLSSASWQRDVWLNDDEFENLDAIVHVLFDDSCDADDPLPWLGASLRTVREADLMRELAAAYDAVAERLPADADDPAHLDAVAWDGVLTVAGVLVREMVVNELLALYGNAFGPISGPEPDTGQT
ncbi:SCO4402 family protein [Embleya sp. MST-111070]|uniref:SCO4402 family protein n=1 Tax=Embleya sp. MST-111070 TaxID=3398231 RepID=UPI003F73A41A